MGIYVGIDVGSRTAKAVVFDGKNILSSSVLPTGSDPSKSAGTCFAKALEVSGIKKGEIRNIVSTGYGRKRVSFATKEYTEITCHAVGATFFFPGARAVVDIGGQDAKVIALDSEGRVVDFVMNDKCAAGTGRFLEVMAHALELSIDEMAERACASRKAVPITSMCTVFAESEVISLIAEGISKERIVWGLHLAIARRISSMAKRVVKEGPVVFTGGVAKNAGMVRALKEVMKMELLVPPDPQIVGALGASILAGRL